MPLYDLELFFTSSTMASNSTIIHVDINLEDDPARLFETTKKINPGDKPYKLKVVSHPKLSVAVGSATDEWITAVATGYTYKSNTMTMTQDWDLKKTRLARG